MASRIAGITIEIGGDTSDLQKSLKSVDKDLKTTQSNLRDVNKLLKLNPASTELLRQKQKNLSEAITKTKDRLQQLNDAQSQVKQGTAEWDALQREIIATEQDLKGLQNEMSAFGSVASQQLKVAGQKISDFGNKVGGVGDKLKPISTAAAGALTGLVGLGYKAVTTADDLNSLSQQTGISTDEIQKMKYAADLVDVSFEDISGALKKMKPKMDDSNETFKKLGVEIRNSDGSLRDVTSVFYDAIDALSKIENETERDQVAMDLFGKSADSLAGVIDDGGAALKEYGKEAEDLGVIMSQETLDALSETNDTIDKLKANLGGTLAKIGADIASILAPALEKAASFIGKITEKLRALTPAQQETIMKVLGIVAAIAPVLIIGGKIIAGIGTLVGAVGSVVGVLGGPLTIAIAAAVAAGILIYKNWDKIKATAIKLWTGIKTAFQNIKSAIVDTWNNVKSATTTAWNNIKEGISNGITNAKTTVTSIIDGIKSKISSTWDTIKSKTSNAFNSIKTAITKPIQQAKSTISGIIDTIKGFFPIRLGNIFDGIKLPHFKVDGGELPWGVGGKGKAPSISIEWYKKAMNNAVMLNGAAIFGAMNGKLLAGGEAGREVIISYDKLAKMMSGNTNINVVVNPSAGMNEKQLADLVARRIQQMVNQRGAVWA